MPETLVQMIKESSEKFSDLPALKIKEGETFNPISYRELYQIIKKLGTALIGLGVEKNKHVGLISDNRYEWIICDLAILGTGACDVPRGSDSTPNELEYILTHAEVETCFVEDKTQLEKIYSISENLPDLKTLIVIDEQKKVDKNNYKLMKVYTMRELIERGEGLLNSGDNRFEEAISRIHPEDLATIIYTSGTTGNPKGVMLSHKNIMHNVINSPKAIPITTGDRFLSILPAWHSFERTIEYILLYIGASNAYSKPSAQVLLKDLAIEKPNYIASVPRIWEALYNAIHYKIRKESIIKRAIFHLFVNIGIKYKKNWFLMKNLVPRFEKVHISKRIAEILKSITVVSLLKPLVIVGDKLVYSQIREKTGGCLKAGISGGGALQKHVDDFFAGINLNVLEGYGLTETSPIVSVRTFERPVPYTVGPLLNEVEVKIVNEEGRELPAGEKGIIMVRGPLVMMGYYKNPEATRSVLTPDGWLNTGDLGRMTIYGELQITGRAKDTIVLLGGENIEPMPLEHALLQSKYIAQVVVVGQDKKTLGALIVPNFETLREWALENNITYTSIKELLEKIETKALYRNEIKNYISPKYGFRAVEYISNFKLLPKEFEVGKELTHTLKIRRNYVQEIYRDLIDSMYR